MRRNRIGSFQEVSASSGFSGILNMLSVDFPSSTQLGFVISYIDGLSSDGWRLGLLG